MLGESLLISGVRHRATRSSTDNLLFCALRGALACRKGELIFFVAARGPRLRLVSHKTQTGAPFLCAAKGGIHKNRVIG